MTHTYTPRRDFALFGDEVRDFEKSDDILDVLTDTMSNLNQNIGAYIGGKFIGLWLGEGEPAAAQEADLDLLFVNQIDGFIDIVLRQKAGLPVAGGALLPSVEIKVTDEILDGYRVIIGIDENGVETRYEFVGGAYFAVGPAALPETASKSRRKSMTRS